MGDVDDPLEQEADRIADTVLAGGRADFGRVPITVQRHASTTAPVPGEAPASVHRALAEPGRPLDPAVRRDLEPRFGRDFSHVRVHDGEVAASSARDIGALAYTVGHDLVFASGAYAPDRPEGRRLIAHELAHVLQQDAGRRVRRQTPQSPGGPGSGLRAATTFGPGTTLRPPPDTSEWIDVRATHVRRQDWAPVYHLFIVSSNLSGKQSYYRGMAGGQCAGIPPGGWGTISTQHGPYDTNSPDWAPGAPFLTVSAGSACRGKEACFVAQLSRITATCTPYGPLGPNSNTVVRTLLSKCGVPQAKPVDIAPGWSDPEL
jgi:hypothetical protein